MEMSNIVYLVADLLLNGGSINTILRLRLTNKHLYETFNIDYISEILGVKIENDFTLKDIVEIYEIKIYYDKKDTIEFIYRCAKYDRYEYLDKVLESTRKEMSELEFINELNYWYEIFIEGPSNKVLKYLLSLEDYLLNYDKSDHNRIISHCIFLNNVEILKLYLNVYNLNPHNYLNNQFDRCGGKEIYDYLIFSGIIITKKDVKEIVSFGNTSQLSYITRHLSDELKKYFLLIATDKIEEDHDYFLYLLDEIGVYCDYEILAALYHDTPDEVVEAVMFHLCDYEIEKAIDHARGKREFGTADLIWRVKIKLGK